MACLEDDNIGFPVGEGLVVPIVPAAVLFDLGIGKALLKKLAGICVERGCGRLEWVVLDWNTPAIDFYQGAQLMKEWITNRVTGNALVKLASD